jgi:hypothetical protein
VTIGRPVVEHRSKRQTELMNSTIRALASTSRVKPLFPDRLAALASDQSWAELARSVRTHTAAVVEASDYPFAAFYQGDDSAVDQVAGTVFRLVFEEVLADRRGLPGREDRRASTLPIDEAVDVLRDLIDYRLRASRADRAGRRLSAPTDDFDLVAFAWRTRMSPIAKEEDDLLAFSDLEISYFVSGRNESVVVDKTSRGSQRRVLGNFSSELDALRFLVMLLGVNRRTRTELELAPGVTLEDGPTATHLTWSDGWADFPKGIGGRGNALDFSRVVGKPLAWIALPPPETS